MTTRCVHATHTLGTRQKNARRVGHALEARWVRAHGALGVRYTSVDEHTTHAQRVPRVCPACAPRVSGVGPTRSAHGWRPSGVYIHASSFAHSFVHAQKSRRTQRTTTNAQRWSSALDARVAHGDAHPTNDDALAKIGLYRDVWIAAIASSTTSLATRTAAICVRFQGRRVRRVYVTMQITFLTRKSALIYRRQRVASLTLNCNGDFAIRAYCYFFSAPAVRRSGVTGALRRV